MKILIVSDTHRRDGNLREIIEKQSPFDMLTWAIPRAARHILRNG